MSWLDRLLGTAPQTPDENPGARKLRRPESGVQPIGQAPSDDAQALDRYRYMLRTAPPEALEQAHAEAFARLTPEQRQQVLGELARQAPDNERAAVERTSPEDSRGMGRLATRAEMRQPGFMERTFGGGGMLGGVGGSLLGSFAMGFAGSMIANSFFSALDGGHGGEGDAGDQDVAGDVDPAADQTDFGGEDLGGDDLGGGDFGGGDFDV